MINIKEKKDCCGCYSCVNKCPKQCIDMITDEEGFKYPKVDKDKCVDCGLCNKACPVECNIKDNEEKYINTEKALNKDEKTKNEIENKTEIEIQSRTEGRSVNTKRINNKVVNIKSEIKEFETIAYACKNKNEEVRISSSSGGVFGNLCEKIISKNGVVFGAAFDENFEVKHTFADTLKGCEKFKGSKYVQSEIGNTYTLAKEFLDKDRLVLFSGTQCQIKGLKLFLQKEYSNLLAVDVICHGVPSPKIFKMYKANLVQKYNSQITNINFRDKEKGWNEFSCKIDFKNKEIYSKTLKEDIFMKGFLKDLYLRESCYNCKAKNYESGSDISLADYWGVQKIHKEFDDDKGTSLVIINNNRGMKAFDEIKNQIESIKTDLKYSIKNNPCIIKPVKYNKKRKEFFDSINNENLEEKINEYSKITIIKKINIKIRKILSKVKRSIIKKQNFKIQIEAKK